MSEFNLSLKDLAIVEIYVKNIAKEAGEAIENDKDLTKKLDVDLSGIEEPMAESARLAGIFGENVEDTTKKIIQVIDDYKERLIKTDDDRSAYDEALSSAQKSATADIAGETKAQAKQRGAKVNI